MRSPNSSTGRYSKAARIISAAQTSYKGMQASGTPDQRPGRSSRSRSPTLHRSIFPTGPLSLVVIRDVTERKRSEANASKMKNCEWSFRKETELHAMRSRFISMVSHEFRRPLTTITTSVELLENYRSRMTEEAAQKHFSRIHEQLDRDATNCWTISRADARRGRPAGFQAHASST